MPHAALRSSALYRVPGLDGHLATLGYRASKAGYLDLIETVAKAGGALSRNHLPSDRTVHDMMIHRVHAKYDTCARLRDALAEDARRQGTAIAPFIEENEFLIGSFSGKINKISGTSGIKAAEVLYNLAVETEMHRPLLKAMSFGFRTTEDNCNRVAEAAMKLYNHKLLVTNAITFKRRSSHPFAPVPPKQEGLF